jgi:hypothetical protein
MCLRWSGYGLRRCRWGKAAESHGTVVVTYPGLDFDKREIAAAMREAYDLIIDFITTPEFKALHAELMSLPLTSRPDFVRRVILEEDELAKRGITIPPRILIQRSAFGDRRPTLFVVKVFLPKRFHSAWENVNFTFDNDYSDPSVSRDPDLAWRPPLPVGLQSNLMSLGQDLQAYDVHGGTNSG